MSLIEREVVTFTLKLTIRADDVVWVVVDDDFSNRYGAGETKELAVIDYLESLAEHWSDLIRDEKIVRLGLGLRKELRGMRDRIGQI